MIRRPPRSTRVRSSAASDVYKRQGKGGVNTLTKVLALEWAPFGVTVNAIAPTWIYTPGTAARLDDPTFLAGVLARIPIGRVGTTADVAAAVVFLSSRASGLITGAVLPVDGGWTAQ